MKMNPNDQNKDRATTENTSVPRRPYVAPVLTQLGSIEDLTRGGSGRSPDGRFFRFKT